MNVLGRKNRGGGGPSEVILAFVQSWEMHGTDEISICSGTLDIIRAYLGERPCCVWKNNNSSISKLSERGMVEVFYSNEKEGHQAALARTLVSGTSEFDPCNMDALTSDFQNGYDGFLHIPIKTQDNILGILTVAVTKKESRDREFVQPLECLARLMAIATREGDDRDANTSREKNLRSEVEATTRELEQTNTRLIERVRELKTLSGELEKRVQELTVANKAKDEFLSIVSHELRTPLTSLNGFLCVLRDEEAGPLNEAQRKFLGIAKQAADRLNLLISDLLDISRIESGRLTMDMNTCSLFDILQTSVQGLKSAAELKKIRIRFQSNPMLPVVWGDLNRLQQVVDNLVANAIKFTDREGTVDVITEAQGDFVKVSVKDTGPGLAPEDQQKVFDMFYQVDASARRRAGGAGLGLAIAHGIVALHGGKIWVESEIGKGSTFIFIIPLSKAKKAA